MVTQEQEDAIRDQIARARQAREGASPTRLEESLKHMIAAQSMIVDAVFGSEEVGKPKVAPTLLRTAQRTRGHNATGKPILCRPDDATPEELQDRCPDCSGGGCDECGGTGLADLNDPHSLYQRNRRPSRSIVLDMANLPHGATISTTSEGIFFIFDDYRAKVSVCDTCDGARILKGGYGCPGCDTRGYTLGRTEKIR